MRISLVVWAHCGSLFCSQTISNGACRVGHRRTECLHFRATVRLTDGATGGARVTVTNDAGRYSLNVRLTLRSEHLQDRFSVYQVNAQRVEVGLTLTVNAETRSDRRCCRRSKSIAGSGLQSLNATVGSTPRVLTALTAELGTRHFHAGHPATRRGSVRRSCRTDERPEHVPTRRRQYHQRHGWQPDHLHDAVRLEWRADRGEVPTPVESIDESRSRSATRRRISASRRAARCNWSPSAAPSPFYGSAAEYYFATNTGRRTPGGTTTRLATGPLPPCRHASQPLRRLHR